MSATGLIKSRVAFAKSLFKSSAKTTSASAIKATEKELFSSTSKAATLKSAKTVPYTKEKLYLGRDRLCLYDAKDNLTNVTFFDKKGKMIFNQEVHYNSKGMPAYLETIPNNPEQPIIYRQYGYNANNQLKLIETTNSKILKALQPQKQQ